MGVSAGQFTHRPAGVRDPRHPQMFGGYQWQIGPAVKPNDIFGIAVTRPDLFGVPLQAFLRDASRHLAYMVGFAGGVPLVQNRVGLADTRDRHGLRQARLEHATDAASIANWRYLLAQGQAAARAAGAHTVWTGPRASGHASGGTVMGRDPGASVVDEYGCAHDVRNLFVAGSGLFPACGGVSPTFTIHAVALRSAEQLLQRWTDHARVG